MFDHILQQQALPPTTEVHIGFSSQFILALRIIALLRPAKSSSLSHILIGQNGDRLVRRGSEVDSGWLCGEGQSKAAGLAQSTGYCKQRSKKWRARRYYLKSFSGRDAGGVD